MVERAKGGILAEPHQPINIPKDSQWLAGQGAGSWFHIVENETKSNFMISRFSPNGILEFEANFKTNSEFCVDCPYAFTYLSHYKRCHIIQHGETICFENIYNSSLGN